MTKIQKHTKVNTSFYIQGITPTGPFQKIIDYYGLEVNTTDFIGHAVALYTNDDFLLQNSIPTIDKIRLYMNSVGRYGDSPFIYPIYGLSGIPEGFSRYFSTKG